jgi:microcystin-dependent protein
MSKVSDAISGLRSAGVDSAKLGAIEAGATADQTKADIEGLGIAASSITGDLPAISGASLTDLPPGSPTGSVVAFASSTPPTGWLKANGAAISRSSYPDLFSAISTLFGVGDGSTTFQIPDMRGKFIRSWDDGRGVDVSRAFGSDQADAIRNIIGAATVGKAWYSQTSTGSGAFSSTTAGTPHSFSSYATSGYFNLNFNASNSVPTAADNRPTNVALLYCIKY